MKKELVYTNANAWWGLVPMEVTQRVPDSATVICKHPTLGTGGFHHSELIPATAKRKKELAPLVELDKERQKLKSKLFKPIK